MSTPWTEFVTEAAACRLCAPIGVVNILAEFTHPEGAWGLPWYDLHRNLDAGVVFVAMDFGNESAVSVQRAITSRIPNFVPPQKGPGEDKSCNRLHDFLSQARLRDGSTLRANSYVTNSALCVRPGDADEGARYGDGTIYRNCSLLLKRQLDIVRPYFIVPLGSEATLAIAHLFGLHQYSGKILTDVQKCVELEIGEAKVTVVPFLHPRQGQAGWDDQAQRTRLYGLLANELSARMAGMPKVEHRRKWQLKA